MRKLILLSILFATFTATQAQNVECQYLIPKFDYSNYSFIRFGTANSFYGGLMYNKQSAGYGNGDDLSLYTTGNRDLTFRTGTGNIILFPQSSVAGNVGIGTIDPIAQFEVQSNSSHLARFFYNDNATTSTRPRLDIYGSPNLIRLRTTYGNGGADLALGTHYAANAIYINEAGDVGIGGITIPDAKLHVFGSNAGQGNPLATIMIGKTKGPAIQAIQASADDDIQDLAFRVKASSTNADNNIEVVRIKYNGKVGIGTTMPDAKLHVFGSNVGAQNVLASIMLGKNNGAEIQAIQAGQDDDVHELAFRVKSSGTNADDSFEAMRIRNNGKVGIGTTTPDYDLDVVGTIRAHEIRVNTDKTADFVFAPDYHLRTLQETEAFIQENQHLPEIASANEMLEEGVNMAEFQIQLLQKIEELTLYVIELEKENKMQQGMIDELMGK